MRSPVVWVCLAALLGSGFAACAAPDAAIDASKNTGTVILISLDGFRPDYLSRYEAPNLRRLAAGGACAPEGMVPVFPSLTFPSHYSIVTGLYPEHHGIVGNTIYDPEWDAWFRIRDPSALADARWYGGEPIWVTAERQGLRSATFFWVGSEAAVGGVRPSYWKAFDGSIPGKDRVAQVLRWLDLPTGERPALITLYFGEVDSKGHRYGPDSAEVAGAVRRVDGHLGRLIQGLETREMLGQVNLLVVSDHGMAATSPERVIVLDDHVDLSDVRIVTRSPVVLLRPKPDKLNAVYEALKGAHPHLAVYRREEVPPRLHFRDHRRIAPLVGLADEGWSIVADRGGNAGDPPLGMHGYDNALVSMRALFVAHGPAFRSGAEIEPFESIQLYEMMAAVLGLEPAPNDGNPDALRSVLSMGGTATMAPAETRKLRNRSQQSR